MEDDLIRGLGRVESKVDMILERQTLSDSRIRDLEISRGWMRGVLAVLAVAWAALLKIGFGGK